LLVYKNYKTFKILDDEIIVISNETEYGISTAVEINSTIYYLGLEEPTLENVMFAWQDFNETLLSEEQFEQILKENQEK
jgi:ABC-type branched-subunit amino acid transport system substrate-binding protein